ncbi:YihY/virulence factor BrkB family protein [Bythopirellula polymerisocia]|uniref:Uncharacterized protein n=1 Tax=Bythopirellula polymerisocia TaxID=2528003 RepID=A0A5C6CYN7_9BACT|nr:YihY/virulence factor BrkB family protein [Bythopirellula polymerisocia]TWU29732.1 ribonuclease BN/unknown domain fusion protein [Bythopirellula polymerisocia]
MNKSRSLRAFIAQLYKTYTLERPTHFAASLAYYSLFSLVPIIYVAITVAGLFVDNDAASDRLMDNIDSVFGADVAEMVITTLEEVSDGHDQGPLWKRGISFVAILAGASLVFFHLQHALTSIWKMPQPEKSGARKMIWDRMLASVIVLGIGLLIVLITLTNFVISILNSQFNIEQTRPLISLIATVLVGTLSLALMFKYMTNAIVAWRDSLVGGLVTTLLLVVGANLLGRFVAQGNFGSAFEAAGTVAVLLIAVYFLAQCLVFGTVFTRVYANMYGSGIRPRIQTGRRNNNSKESES